MEQNRFLGFANFKIVASLGDLLHSRTVPFGCYICLMSCRQTNLNGKTKWYLGGTPVVKLKSHRR